MVTADLRLAVRALRQAPTFTLTAVLSLALGIGASTSVYALTFTLFFAPPAGVDQPESLVRICRLANGRPEGHELSYAEYVYYRDHATVFTELASDGNVKMLTDTESGDPAAGRRRLTELFHRARTPATRGSLLPPERRHGRRSRPGRRLEPRLLAEAVRGRRSQHRRTPHARRDVLRDRRRRASELRRLERRLGSRHLRAHPCGLQRGRPRERKERTTGPHRPAQAWSHARGGAGRDDGPGPPVGAGGSGHESRRQPPRLEVERPRPRGPVEPGAAADAPRRHRRVPAPDRVREPGRSPSDASRGARQGDRDPAGARRRSKA